VQSVLNGGEEKGWGLSVSAEGTQAVRGSTDERLQTGRSYTVRLFGVLPVKTVQSVGASVAASGGAIGIRMQIRGVQIVGLGGIRTTDGTVHPAEEAGLRPGDAVLSVNGEPVTSNASFTALCGTDQPVTLQCLRGNTPFSVTVTPARDTDGVYRIGVWVRDSTSGIGTLSFWDPVTRRYAALGHGVTDVDTGTLFGSGGGQIFPAEITGVRRATGTQAGELIGRFSMEPEAAAGSIQRNTVFGIAGTLTGVLDGEMLPVAAASEAHPGAAEVWSTVDGTAVRRYAVRVIRLDVHASAETNGLMIEVTDRALLDRTGGIVQGMSGSPVVQDGKLIAVVTHVFLNDSTRGYCLYAEQMYEKLIASD